MTANSVSLLGLGNMGAALASTFLAAGWRTTVFNRSRARVSALAAAGATAAATAAEAVRASELVVVCVHDDAAVHALLDPIAESLAGRTLVNLTTASPDEARANARWATAHGATYLGGAIMAMPPMMGRPEALVFYSGARAAIAAFEAGQRVLGTGAYLGEDAGLAGAYDFALLSMLYGAYTAGLHGFALAGAAGVAPGQLVPHARAWLTDVVVPAILGAADEIEARDYSHAISPVSLNAAALAKLVDATRAAGLRADLLVPVRAILDERSAAGHGADSLASLIEVIRGGVGQDLTRP